MAAPRDSKLATPYKTTGRHSGRTSGLIVALALLASLAGCAYHMYKQARTSDPHATLTFEKGGKGSDNHPWAHRLNGGRRPDHMFRNRSTFRIGAGTMRLEIGESYGEAGLNTSGPRFTCEASFEAEAGRHYRVSSAWDDDGYLYVVTADPGAKVAECKAHEKGEGAIVVREEAPVYKKAHGTDVTWTLKRGDAVVATCLTWPWQFCEKSGRAQIAFLDETAGSVRGGWMSLADLATFTYFFCNYRGQVGGSYSDGYPFTPGENPFALEEKRGWSTCFRKARDAKFKELRTAWAMEKAATSTKAFPDKSDQQPKPEKPWSRPEGVATISLDGLSPAHPG